MCYVFFRHGLHEFSQIGKEYFLKVVIFVQKVTNVLNEILCNH